MNASTQSDDLALRHIWLYVLELENNKFYVGITARPDPAVRIQQHVAGKGAKWTKEYSPIAILELHDLGMISWEEAEKEEHNTTIEYVDKYGIKNVRGGSMTYTGTVYKFFGRYYQDYLAKDILGVMFMMLVIIILGYMAIFN